MVSLDDVIAMQEALDEGEFDTLDQLLLPMDTAVLSLPEIMLDSQQYARFEHGQSVLPDSVATLVAGEQYRVYTRQDDEVLFLGVGEAVVSPKDQPRADAGEVFVSPKRRVVYTD